MAVQAFKIIRESLGWTRYKMAKELGVSESHLRHIEENGEDTRGKNLIKLQKVSGLSPTKFWQIYTQQYEE